MIIAAGAPVLAELELECAHCGKHVVSATLADVGLAQRGFFGEVETRVAAERIEPLRVAMAARDVAAMHALAWDYAPYFCRQCRAAYCSACWQGIPEFDDGFYDCTRGTCPASHAQMIDD